MKLKATLLAISFLHLVFVPKLIFASEYGLQQVMIQKIIHDELRTKSFNKNKLCEDCYVFPTNPTLSPWSYNPKISNISGTLGGNLTIQQNNKTLPRTIIPVCWKNTISSLSTTNQQKLFNSRKRLVRNAAREWEAPKGGNLLFSGWGLCPNKIFDGISIEFTNNTSGSMTGVISKKYLPSMYLQEDRTDLFGLSVHEFGHALGLYHEQINPKTTKECHAYIKEHQPHTLPTDAINRANIFKISSNIFDKNSVMNYCNNLWHHGKPSALDKEALQVMYPFKDYSLISLIKLPDSSRWQ